MTNSSINWRCLGKSIRGASHHRNQIPNQDAIAWYPHNPQMGEGTPLILAISDGHGSLKNFRSQIGAQEAVCTVIQVMSDLFLKSLELEPLNLSTIHDLARTHLPQRVVQEWTDRVLQHWQSHPTESDPNWQHLLDREGETARQLIQQAPQIAYGATLLAILITETFILYIQLGDGDILCVDTAGKTTRPMQRDPRLLGNETTSLCTTEAWKDFQVRLEPYSADSIDQIPALILLCTDGYANSYPSEAEFSKIGRDYLHLIRQDGLMTVARQLPVYLDETSQGGSGDDITLGIIRRIELKDRDDMIQQQESQSSRLEDTEKKIKFLNARQNSLAKQVRILWSVAGIAIVASLLLIPINWQLWNKMMQVEQKLEKQQEVSKNLERELTQSKKEPAKAPK